MLIAEQKININALIAQKTRVDIKSQQNMYFFIFKEYKDKVKVSGKVHYMEDKKEAINWLRKLSLHKDSGVLKKYDNNNIVFYYIDPKKQLTFLRALITHKKNREMAREIIDIHNTAQKSFIVATGVKNIYSALKPIAGCAVHKEYISLFGEKIPWNAPLSNLAADWLEKQRTH